MLRMLVEFIYKEKLAVDNGEHCCFLTALDTASQCSVCECSYSGATMFRQHSAACSKRAAATAAPGAAVHC